MIRKVMIKEEQKEEEKRVVLRGKRQEKIGNLIKQFDCPFDSYSMNSPMAL